MSDLETLSADWLRYKTLEERTVVERRKIEDQLVKQIEIPENLDGTKNVELGEYKIKIEGRINKKINSEKLQELAAESGLEDHLSSLFRWKPEINVAAWKNAAENITGKLAGAITTTPGRPSFSISKKEEK